MFTRKILSRALIAVSALYSAAPAMAGDTNTRNVRVYHEPVPSYAAPTVIDHTDSTFRHAHPIRVHLTLRDPNKPGDVLRFNNRTYSEMVSRLPDNIIPVADPQYAHMHLSVTLTNYDVYFRPVDTDRKDKKYKKSRRYVGGQCGQLKKAYYTKVKEEGVAHAGFHIQTRLKGARPHAETITVSASERYSYGTNLTASSNCGRIATHFLPSNGVAELFDKATPDYRHKVATDIQRETADKLGNVLANHIRSYADSHYVALAHKMTQNMSHISRGPAYSHRAMPRRYWAKNTHEW